MPAEWGEDSYACRICGALFRSIKAASDHEATCTNERPKDTLETGGRQRCLLRRDNRPVRAAVDRSRRLTEQIWKY